MTQNKIIKITILLCKDKQKKILKSYKKFVSNTAKN